MKKHMVNAPQTTQEYANNNGILKGHRVMTPIFICFVLYEAVYPAHHYFIFFI